MGQHQGFEGHRPAKGAFYIGMRVATMSPPVGLRYRTHDSQLAAIVTHRRPSRRRGRGAIAIIDVVVVPPLLVYTPALTGTIIRPIACNIFSHPLTLIDVLQLPQAGRKR